MGSRRTHEQAAVASARAAYLAGFASTSNLEAGRRHGIPTTGTSAHAFTLLHDSEQQAFRTQVDVLGTDTTLLVDTYDISKGIDDARSRWPARSCGAIRIDSGDLGVMARQARDQLDALGARNTRIVVSGDLDEFAIASLRAEPVDAYGVGTSVVTGSGAPTAGMVYKLVEVDGSAGGQTQFAQGIPWWPQGGVAQAQGKRHRAGRGRLPRRRRDRPTGTRPARPRTADPADPRGQTGRRPAIP